MPANCNPRASLAMTLLIEANVKFLSLADIPANILKEAPLMYCDAFIPLELSGGMKLKWKGTYFP